MLRKVPPSLYAPAQPWQIEAQLRRGEMPSAFTRRMRTINLLSATTLMKIEDRFLLPFDVMDLHHILDLQISQDAILDQLDNEELSYACTTGNVSLLWEIAPENPLLLRGFTSGWISKFLNEPFDPLCVMLAMRCKAMLDLVDQEGHSYNLIRKLGFGFIDFGDIPGEEPGDPGDYYPPEIDNPIDIPEIPTPPGPEPGEPGYVEPGPGLPGYVPPGPGEPGYVPGPGEPGYTEPGTTPDTNLGGGPGGGAPWGGSPGPGDLGGAAASGGSTSPPTGDPCADVDDPLETVTIGYTTQGMAVDETQELTVEGAHPRWSYENYTWKVSGGGGSIYRTGQDPPEPIVGPEEEGYDEEAYVAALSVIYTAPPANAECAKNPTIELWCGGNLMASLKIAVNVPQAGIAYLVCYTRECPPCEESGGYCGHCHVNYLCDGAPTGGIVSALCDCVEEGGSNWHYSWQTCAQLGYAEGVDDQRSVDQIQAGCCPEALL